jgi:hypothetical protein
MTSESGHKVTPGSLVGAPVLTLCRVCDKQEVITVWVGYALTLWDSKLVLTTFRCNGSGPVLLEGSARPRRLYRSCFRAHGYDV